MSTYEFTFISVGHGEDEDEALRNAIETLQGEFRRHEGSPSTTTLLSDGEEYECAECGETDHPTSECPNAEFCDECGSSDHETWDCPNDGELED